MMVVAAILFVVQSALGAIVVFLMAALLGAAMVPWYRPTRVRRDDTIPMLAAVNATMAL